ncbi:hypothetical protein GWE18_16900 [Bradyrhizobium sp. CSA112]|uniref:hypothetical protein n=1 Tax=Bradyrhizobium sp. CSA112 TaxID=2699170 RepID=UPI0023AF41D4|nr:hypothetical protein [Bradyrhizobium sp. CSA112]MDE5454487.1 hypothetical protein [Bradyrhizobium sp. CSA112]
MRKTILSMLSMAALMFLIGGSPQVLAQGGSSTVTKSPDRPIPQAPVGHRQPRASDVPSEKTMNDPNDPLSKENAALDRKIKSICRGC